MSREEDAHYLHARRGLSVLVRPPVRGAALIAWDGQGELIVATIAGSVLRVHPAMGTRTLLEGLAPPVGLGVDNDRFVYVGSDGRWVTHDLSGASIISGEHPFEGPVAVQFREGKTVLTGITSGEKQVLFYDSGRSVLRIQLPAYAIGFISGGHFGLAQSTPVGLETLYLRDGGRFHGVERTSHSLQASRDHVLGVHAAGLRVWSIMEGEHVDVALRGVTAAAMHEDGQLVAMGTQDGDVALVDLENADERQRPQVVEATDQAIRAVAFSPKGSYLATAADTLLIWTWG